MGFGGCLDCVFSDTRVKPPFQQQMHKLCNLSPASVLVEMVLDALNVFTRGQYQTTIGWVRRDGQTDPVNKQMTTETLEWTYDQTMTTFLLCTWISSYSVHP